MERLSSGGTILVRGGGAREFFSRLLFLPAPRKLRHEEIRGETKERERGPRLSRSHKTNERIPFFSRVPSRRKGTRRKRRQKENGRQHRFDLTEWRRGGERCPREIHARTEGTTDDESSLPLATKRGKNRSLRIEITKRKRPGSPSSRFFARFFVDSKSSLVG